MKWFVLTAALALPMLAGQPFFERYTLPVPTQPDKRTVYGQHPFAWNGMPMLARAGDGRLFLLWTASRGFAGGGRLVGAFSADQGRTWSPPVLLTDNPDRDDTTGSIVVDGNRLLVISQSIRLPEYFDKYNPFPVRYDRAWWWMTATEDGGRTWSKPLELPIPFVFPGSRTAGFRLPDGTLVLPSHFGIEQEAGQTPKLEGDTHSVTAMMRSLDGGRTWKRSQVIRIPHGLDTSEPAAVRLSNGDLYCLLRNMIDRMYSVRSHDGGLTWSAPEPAPLPAHDTPFALTRLDRTPGDELVVVWNNHPGQRNPLVAAHSPDGGRSWSAPKQISAKDVPPQYNEDNPGVAQASDGTIVVVWQQDNLPRHLGKELQIARFNRDWLTGAN